MDSLKPNWEQVKRSSDVSHDSAHHFCGQYAWGHRKPDSKKLIRSERYKSWITSLLQSQV